MATDTLEVRKLFGEALKIWSPSKQIGMLHEEIGELMVSMNRYDRGRGTKEDILTEIVDVEILLGQMKILYGIKPKDYASEYMSKVMRLDSRITKSKNRGLKE